MKCPKCNFEMKKVGRIGFAVIYVCPKCNLKTVKELPRKNES